VLVAPLTHISDGGLGLDEEGFLIGWKQTVYVPSSNDTSEAGLPPTLTQGSPRPSTEGAEQRRSWWRRMFGA
jgi:hypothetical protein